MINGIYLKLGSLLANYDVKPLSKFGGNRKNRTNFTSHSLRYPGGYRFVRTVTKGLSLSRHWSRCCWKHSGVGLIPYGIRSHLYLSHGVWNGVSLLYFSSSCILRNPFFRSGIVNTFAFDNSCGISSIIGRG